MPLGAWGFKSPLRHDSAGEDPDAHPLEHGEFQTRPSPADTSAMETEELLSWLGPPSEEPTPGHGSLDEHGLPGHDVPEPAYLPGRRRYDWRVSVLDDSHRIQLPLPARASVALGIRLRSLLVAERGWPYHTGSSSPLGIADPGSEPLPFQRVALDLDARSRMLLPWPARAHLDATPGDPLVLGVEEHEGWTVVHIVGPAVYDSAVGRPTW